MKKEKKEEKVLKVEPYFKLMKGKMINYFRSYLTKHLERKRN